MEAKSLTPWMVWKQALRFYLDNAPKFLVVFPILFIPVFVDTLLTILIVQQRRVGCISMAQGLIIAISRTPAVLFIKLRFWIIGGLWSIIPILGWYKSFRYRVYWAMASNVVIHEELSGELAVERCRELAEIPPLENSFRALVTIPTLIETVLFITLLLGTTLTNDPTLFGLCMFGIAWTWFPWSAAVNSFYYFNIPQESIESTLNLRKNTSYEEFCPTCIHFGPEGKMCRRFQINVVEYPSQFKKYCASKYYESRVAA
jgi:hypothetical protein